MSTLKVDNITDVAGTGSPSINLERLFYYKDNASTGLVDVTTYDVVFNAQVENTFSTSEYNSSTGIFTATRDGIYLIEAFVHVRSASANALNAYELYLDKSGSRIFQLQDVDGTTYASRKTRTFSFTVSLTSSDTLKVQTNVNTSTGTWSIHGASGTPYWTGLSMVKIG